LLPPDTSANRFLAIIADWALVCKLLGHATIQANQQPHLGYLPII